MVDIEDPQVELHLLRSCLSVCKVTHLLRCVPSSSLGSFPSRFVLRLRECPRKILCCGISDSSWTQTTLLLRLGGLGVRESECSAAPAFVGSWNSAGPYFTDTLVETSVVLMFLYHFLERSVSSLSLEICLFLCCITPLKMTFKLL